MFKKQNLLTFLFFASIAAIPNIFWIKSRHLIAGGDFFPPIFPFRLITISRFIPLYIWNNYLQAGTITDLAITKIFPYFTFWALFKKIGLTIFFIQRLWFTFVFLGCGLSMYFLLRIILSKKYNTVCLFGVLFYIFNPYLSFWTTIPSDTLILTYVFTPLILGLFILWFRNISSKNFLALLILSSTFLYTSACNPPIYTIPWIFIALFFIYSLFLLKKGRFKITKNFIVFIVLLVMVNIWWLFPLFYKLFFSSPAQQIYSGVSPEWFIRKSQDSSFLNVFRFLGKWSFHSGFKYKGDFFPYYPHIGFYYKPLIITIGYLLASLPFCCLLFKERRKYTIFFAFSSLIFIFLAKGTHSPLGNINLLFYKYIPGFIIYRESLAKFIPAIALCYSVMLAIFVSGISDSFKRIAFFETRTIKIVKMATLSLLAFIIIINGIGIFTGAIIPKKRGSLHSFYVKVPKCWVKVNEFFKNTDVDYRILLSPANPFVNVSYDWYTGVDRSPYFIKKPIVRVTLTGGPSTGGFFTSLNIEKYIKSFFRQLNQRTIHDSKGSLAKYLKFLNIRYILQRNDLDWSFGKSSNLIIDSPHKIKEIFTKTPGIKLIASVGKLDLYKISDEYFLPHIYPTATPTLVAGDLNALLPMTETKYLGGEWETGNGKWKMENGKWEMGNGERGKPLLLFTGQNKALGSHILAHIFHFPVTNFVFEDSNWRDLAVETIAHSSWLIADGKKEREANSSLLISHRFRIKKAGRYEVYVDTEASTNNESITNLRIKVDGKQIALSSWLLAHGKDRKYIHPVRYESISNRVKIGEVELGEGEHTITAHSSLLIAHRDKTHSSRLLAHSKNIKIVLVNKEERGRIDKELKKRIEKPETEVCYIFEKEGAQFYVP